MARRRKKSVNEADFLTNVIFQLTKWGMVPIKKLAIHKIEKIVCFFKKVRQFFAEYANSLMSIVRVFGEPLDDPRLVAQLDTSGGRAHSHLPGWQYCISR